MYVHNKSGCGGEASLSSDGFWPLLFELTMYGSHVICQNFLSGATPPPQVGEEKIQQVGDKSANHFSGGT